MHQVPHKKSLSLEKIDNVGKIKRNKDNNLQNLIYIYTHTNYIVFDKTSNLISLSLQWAFAHWGDIKIPKITLSNKGNLLDICIAIFPIHLVMNSFDNNNSSSSGSSTCNQEYFKEG